MVQNIPLFLKRFSLSYYKEGSCVEYFINDTRNMADMISSALILSYNSQIKDVHVSRFYPELHNLPDSRYLSAACFYLMIHHFVHVFALDNSCHISLETVQDVSDNFYSKLRDFNFLIRKHGVGSNVELISDLIKSNVDTSMIMQHLLEPGEIPFLK